MSNYTKYPYHRFLKGSCVIVFPNEKYSWCWFTKKQKAYLLSSHYLDNAIRIDVKTKDDPDEVKQYSIEEFKRIFANLSI